MTQHPYDIIPALRTLRSGKPVDSEELHHLADRVAISMPDMTKARDVLGENTPCFDDFYASAPPVTPSTVDTIDTFLNTFGKQNSRETEALTKMIFNPTPDYAAVLAAEEQNSSPTPQEMSGDGVSEQDRLINSFIAKTKSTSGQLTSQSSPDDEPENDKSDILTNPASGAPSSGKEPENTSLTESFARVMIKNGNYSRALKIISELSLKNPEKSIYFADQIRFLRKLIINENNK